MSKPEDIPRDVWDAASIKALEYVEWLIPQPDYIADSEYVLTQVLARAIIAAKAEERERTQPIIDWAERVNRKPYSVAMALRQEHAIRMRGEP